MRLRFEEVRHVYGATVALDRVTLEARAGEILCLFGPSGCGKTTLLRLAAGLEPLQSGRLKRDEEVWAAPGRSLPPEKRSVGLVFQDHALFPHMTVAGNLAFGMPDMSAAARKQAIAQGLAAVGLEGFENRYPNTLSGGQAQRVALARALARRPQVVLMDEPFASVDAGRRRDLRQSARRILTAAGVIAIVVTHDGEEAMEMGDRIAVMGAGRILQCATPREVYDRPASFEVAMALGDAQALDARALGGGLQTPFGDWPAPDGEAGRLAEGPVKLAIRPQGLVAAPAAEGAARLIDKRFLGEGWLAICAPAEADAPALRARLVDGEGAEIGARLRLDLVPSGVKAFPA